MSRPMPLPTMWKTSNTTYDPKPYACSSRSWNFGGNIPSPNNSFSNSTVGEGARGTRTEVAVGGDHGEIGFPVPLPQLGETCQKSLGGRASLPDLPVALRSADALPVLVLWRDSFNIDS